MADYKNYMDEDSLIRRVDRYITQGGRPEYQNATERPKTLTVYENPLAKKNGGLGTFEYYEDGAGGYTKGGGASSFDPYSSLLNDIKTESNYQAPQIKITDGKVKIVAPQEVLDSPVVKQLEKELQSLKGANLDNPEVQNVINKVNEEVRTNFRDAMVDQYLGWTPDEYNDYQRAVQVVSKSNPMNSEERFKWSINGELVKDEDGNIAMKTPKEWRDYWQSHYNADERTDLLYDSMASNNPYDRTMALFLMQGNNHAVEGFSFWDKLGNMWGNTWNQMKRTSWGKTLSSPQVADYGVNLFNLANKYELSNDAFQNLFKIQTQEAFDNKLGEIENKLKLKSDGGKGLNFSDLSDEEKAFVIVSGVADEYNDFIHHDLEKSAEQPNNIRLKVNEESYTPENGGKSTSEGVYYNSHPLFGGGDRSTTAEELDRLDSSWDNATPARKVISDARNRNLDQSAFNEALKQYTTISGTYNELFGEQEDQLAKNSIWSWKNPLHDITFGVIPESEAGTMTGVMGRYLWEAAVSYAMTRGAGGKGINLTKISDILGEKLVGALNRIGVSPMSTFGQSALNFTANLIGTIPEDYIQGVVDNVFIGRPEDNKHLLEGETISDNFKQNLIFMGLVNAAKAGVSSFTRAKWLRQAAKDAKLAEKIDIEKAGGELGDLAKVGRAEDIRINNDDGTVTIIDENGHEKVLKNITPEVAEYTKQALLKGESPDTVASKVEAPKVDAETVENIKAKDGADSVESAAKNADTEAPKIDTTRSEDGAYTEEALLAKSKELYDSRMAQVDRLSDKSMKAPMSKAAGMEKAATDRLITSKFTSRELSNLYNRYNKNFRGKDVIVDGKNAKVINPSIYGRVKVEFEDGSAKTVDSSDISPKYTSAEDVRADIWEKFVRPEIESRLGVKLDKGIIRPAGEDILSETPKVEAEAPKTTPETVSPDAEVPVGKQMDTAAETTKPVGETPDASPVARVEIDDPDNPGQKKIVEVKDYRFNGVDDALGSAPEPTKLGMKLWHRRAMAAIMREFQTHIEELHNKFGDVQASDFDWVWYNIKKLKKKPSELLGSIDPTTGREITQARLDAMKWWSEQPFVKNLRMASREALNMKGDFDTLGYLPHTDYDPSNLAADEIAVGTLWQTSTGKSVLTDGKYTGYGGTLESRYKTFASNMIWDAKSDALLASKMVEEAELDGQPVDANTVKAAEKSAETTKKMRRGVEKTKSTKATVDMLSDVKVDGEDKVSGDISDAEVKKLQNETLNDAKKSKIGENMHKSGDGIYKNFNAGRVVKQRGWFKNSFTTLGDFLKNTVIEIDGKARSLYEYGGADLVYARKNAIELMNRYVNEGGDLRQMFVDYIKEHSKRSTKYAEAIADKWMARVLGVKGGPSLGSCIDELGKAMRGEAYARVRKWMSVAEYDGHIGPDGKKVGGFNDATKKGINTFLFNHMQTDAIMSNHKVIKGLSRALDGLTSIRYRALFYGNFKNALLQVTELNRLFTTFKWGDVAQMAKRLATDSDFRARVEVYVDAVAPDTPGLEGALYKGYAEIADNMNCTENGVTFKDITKTVDRIALAPIESAEAFKNYMMVAALVQEVDGINARNPGSLTGDAALQHIRKRFERVALAGDEMGRIGFSSNALTRSMMFLQNFQVREIGMHIYNGIDEWNNGKTKPQKLVNITKYLTKVFGTKLANALILTRIGYTASQAMGIDPLGLADQYNDLSEDEMTELDKQISGGLLTPLFAGGMTSLLSDLYFMARRAYEDSEVDELEYDYDSDEIPEEITEAAREKDKSIFDILRIGTPSSDKLLSKGAQSFIPGATAAKRLAQTNDMMNSGWAVSESGNRMYTAPTDPYNTILAYLFGRSATDNGRQYSQTSINGLGQLFGRMVGKPVQDVLGALGIGSGYSDFDPVDTKNYSDWFRGDENDVQQFNKGVYYFQDLIKRRLQEYDDATKNATDSDVQKEKIRLNQDLEEIYTKIEKLASAYERKNDTITPAMTRQLINLLNTGEKSSRSDTPEEATARGLQNYNDALKRYSDLGLSPVGLYTGPSSYAPDREVKYLGSPQFRSARNAYYNSRKEAADVLAEADAQILKPIRDSMQDQLDAAWDQAKKGDYSALNTLQAQYLVQFDKVVAPIIAAYGTDVLKDGKNKENKALKTQLEIMLYSMIPSEQYAKNKWGKLQSMPTQSVDVIKWIKQRYTGDLFEHPTARSYSTIQEDFAELQNLINKGQKDRAMAKALQIKVRVDQQKSAIGREQLDWLNKFISNGGK